MHECSVYMTTWVCRLRNTFDLLTLLSMTFDCLLSGLIIILSLEALMYNTTANELKKEQFDFQMVKTNGLHPEVVPLAPRMVNIHRPKIQLIHLVLDHLCIMVVETISTAARQPSKGQNPPLM